MRKKDQQIIILTELTKVALHGLIIAYYGFQADNEHPIPQPEDIAEDAVGLARATIISLAKSTQSLHQG